ncbi:hypothetical protein ACEN8I_23315 [Polaromonas sp. CT11-55]|uniref:hypothetical protein n=1 Tax=Polaromonas sp. CT11-55 TaxID=3243045 RepID=UPI0039A51038
MKARAIWFGIYGLLAVVAADVLANVLSLLNSREAVAKGAAPEDILGYGIAPLWIAVSILLSLLLLQGRKHLRRSQLVFVFVGFVALLVADWATYLKLQASMGL